MVDTKLPLKLMGYWGGLSCPRLLGQCRQETPDFPCPSPSLSIPQASIKVPVNLSGLHCLHSCREAPCLVFQGPPGPPPPHSLFSPETKQNLKVFFFFQSLFIPEKSLLHLVLLQICCLSHKYYASKFFRALFFDSRVQAGFLDSFKPLS